MGDGGQQDVPNDAIAITMDSQPESDDASGGRVGSVSAAKTISSASVSTGGTNKGVD
jgi:hypothetical protein